MRHKVQVILDVHRHRKIKHRPLRNRSAPYRKAGHIIVISAGLELDRIPPNAEVKRTNDQYEVIISDDLTVDEIKAYANQMDAISYIIE